MSTVDSEMCCKIVKKLKLIEKEQNCKILYACESGSRAWGFASADSDYDVRFIYIKNTEDYLSVFKRRVDINSQEYPIDDNLIDVAGWDLCKAVQLLGTSNISLYEWFSSDIIYYQDPHFVSWFKPSLDVFLNKAECAYHYVSMVKTNYNKAIFTYINIKQYLYMIRAILMGLYVTSFDEYPTSIDIKNVMDKLAVLYVDKNEPLEAFKEITKLIDYKINKSTEGEVIDKNTIINNFINKAMDRLSNFIDWHAGVTDLNFNNKEKRLDTIFMKHLEYYEHH